MNPDEIESGPFCAHWGDLVDCEEACLRESCGHACKEHRERCVVPGCACPGLVWKSQGEIVDAAETD